MDFTAHWHWPQWAFAAWLYLSLLINATRHGKEMLVEAGEDEGLPRKYSFFVALVRAAVLLFVLIGGGFFA